MKKILIIALLILLSGCTKEETPQYINQLNKNLKESFNYIDDELQTIKDNQDVLREYINIEKDLEEYRECVIDLFDDILYDYENHGKIDDLYYIKYETKFHTFYYKTSENSKLESITIEEILDNECD